MQRNTCTILLLSVLVTAFPWMSFAEPLPFIGRPGGQVDFPFVAWPLVHIKSPASGMTFTQGYPVRVLAEGFEGGNSWGITPALYVDGVLQDDPESANTAYHNWWIDGLSVGPHTLQVRASYGGDQLESPSIRIVIEASPSLPVVSLDADIVLSGSADHVWDGVLVKGNGYRLRTTSGYSGRITIRNSRITGLGSMSAAGIDVTTNAAITIENNVFERTGALFLTGNGSSAFTMRGNELRANNLLTFTPTSDPERTPSIVLRGNTTGAKLFQGNRVGAGFVLITGMPSCAWLIGGSDPAQSNILIGPRAGIHLDRCEGAIIRGNYSHHDYLGGWSQGFNFKFSRESNLLVEHNIIRQGSWPVDSVGGEFRYNLLLDSGHTQIRTVASNAKIHHNVFTIDGTNVNSAFDAVILMIYDGISGVQIYNNTFEMGGGVTRANFPALRVDAGQVASLRNNIFSGLGDTGAAVSGAANGVLSTDYNLFYNLEQSPKNNYDLTISGKTEGQSAGFGLNDRGGVNAQVDPQLREPRRFPFQFDEADIWNRVQSVRAILQTYRVRFQPVAGSDAIDHGDPADGPGVDIGAIGAGDDDANDRFGDLGTVVTRQRFPDGFADLPGGDSP